VFEVKKRPRFDPLIIHIAQLGTLESLADFALLAPVERERLDILARHLWPGPLTLILPKKDAVPPLATGGLATAAVRFPAHDGALRLIRESTGAIAAPSANPFGYLSPTRADHVRSQLGDAVDIILDGGKCGIGVESTVLDIRGKPRIRRPGGTPQEAIEALIGEVGAGDGLEEKIEAPGQLTSHYAPNTDLFLCDSHDVSRLPFEPDAAYLFFSRASFEGFACANDIRSSSIVKNVFILSENGNIREAASRLFDTLHVIDSRDFGCVYAERAPNEGLGAAINDRLSRAQSDLRRPS
jgi:L-threonylcarbamoyladenylate synthase